MAKGAFDGECFSAETDAWVEVPLWEISGKYVRPHPTRRARLVTVVDGTRRVRTIHLDLGTDQIRYKKEDGRERQT